MPWRGLRQGWWRSGRLGLAVVLGLVGLVGLLGGLWTVWLPELVRPEFSVQVEDRDGKVLRCFTTADGYWRLPARLERIDPQFIRQLIAIEDKRFWQHPGVDPIALLRAGRQLLAGGRIVSGASTISMQTVRLLQPGRRGLGRKVKQIVQALILESRLEKTAILELYLSLAPYGGNIQGIEAASRQYFGKNAEHLTPSESALLLALPQSPERRRPDLHPKAARHSRDRLLARLGELGVLNGEQLSLAQGQDVPLRRRPMPFAAPHLAESLRDTHPGREVLRTTLDGQSQQRVATIAGQVQKGLEKGMTLAVLVVDRQSREVLVHIGAGDYWQGSQMDLTRAIRSPGSTCKPFIYGLGFERGLIHPETLVNDQPEDFGHYRPRNFTKTFQGWLTIRQALQRSLNIPAVQVLQQIGPNSFVQRLESVGVRLQVGSGPSLPLALGGAGCSLTDLVLLYTALANQGVTYPLRFLSDEPLGEGRRLLAAAANWYVDDILKGTPLASGQVSDGQLRFKTGTSFGFRDAWAIGYNQQAVVGVWLGRPDGGYGKSETGGSLAVPVMQRVLAALPTVGDTPPSTGPPVGVLLARHDQLPKNLQYLAGEMIAGEGNLPRIFFPPDGSRIRPLVDATGQPVVLLKAGGGEPPFTWLVDGKPLGEGQRGSVARYRPAGPGMARITLIDDRGKIDRAEIWLDQQDRPLAGPPAE